MKDAHEESEDSAATPVPGNSEAGGKVESRAGQTIRDVVGRAAGANPSDRLNLAESNAHQKAALSSLYARGEAVVPHDPSRIIGGGSEHVVERADDGRVLKHTKEGFGGVLEGHVGPFGGYVSAREATPQEYLQRVDATNRFFGDDVRVEGVSKVGSQVGIATSQRAIRGAEPSKTEVDTFMTSGGLRQVKAEGDRQSAHGG